MFDINLQTWRSILSSKDNYVHMAQREFKHQNYMMKKKGFWTGILITAKERGENIYETMINFIKAKIKKLDYQTTIEKYRVPGNIYNRMSYYIKTNISKNHYFKIHDVKTTCLKWT